MPKMKSHRGAAKRFSKSAGGKLRHQKRNKRHHLGQKPAKRKRILRRTGEVAPASAKRLKQLVPYL